MNKDLSIEYRKINGKKGDLNVCFDCDEKINNEVNNEINEYIPMKFYFYK